MSRSMHRRAGQEASKFRKDKRNEVGAKKHAKNDKEKPTGNTSPEKLLEQTEADKAIKRTEAAQGSSDNATTWKPIKRVSRTTMEKIRTLRHMYPDVYNTVRLSAEFKISTEAVARILKSKFRPTPDIQQRQERNRYAAMGQRRLELQKKFGVPPDRKPMKETKNTQNLKRQKPAPGGKK
ncbi:Required for respiratory growth protein 9 mitochondrial [Apophysomyces ossiformis]|uniref:Required for respiratory growth protein 9, mitochondrial n=1 Tax=Apophysomyces ossiformis TaxID=679940 RepID=A0A8H7EPR2_9FUNG|nr:Required for respiratory growth protein 9 mitochondrial [Apophysomyces ossiformis]